MNMYRVRGHLIADLDPLSWKEPHTHPELDPATYGLTIWDLEREFFVDGVAGQRTMLLGDLLGVLRDAYCRRVGVEYMHIQEPDQKTWIQEQVEGVQTRARPAPEQLHILDRLNAAEAFERFLHTKYTGHKRFGLEGAESLIPLVDEVLDQAAAAGYQEAVLGMAHRGRLNVLANIVGKSFRQIFREFEGDLDPATTQGTGDVKYHLGAAGKFVGRSGVSLPVTLASNPSHLEAVDPVVEGMVRARQDLIDEPEAFTALAVLIHGDAAFAGQGVVAETLNLSALRGYRIGGTIHVVVNNQLGFTTAPEEARSSVYATDIAKMVQAPIFHVNGDDPEAVVRVARLAFGFRQRFHKDVVIDMVCYRRHGHNEGDDPSYTQPLMYKRIEARRSVRKLYTETLVRRGDITMEEAERALDDFLGPHAGGARGDPSLGPARRVVADTAPPPAPASLHARGDRGGPRRPRPRGRGHGHAAARASPSTPSWPAPSRPAHDLYARRPGRLGHGRGAGLRVAPGRGHRRAPVTGQDTRRGTFSQRHQVLVDYETGRGVAAAGGARPRRGRQAVALRLAAVGVRRPRLRVRLLRRPHRRPRGVGGPVRRLRQRGPDRHRPVHHRRPRQVGPGVGPGPAAAPRLRGPGARSTPRPAWSGSSPCAPATTSRSSTPPPRRSTSTSCAARCAGRVRRPARGAHPQVAAAGPPRPLAGRRAHERPLPGGPRRSRRRPTRPRCARVDPGLGQGGLRRHRPPRRARSCRSPSCGSSSSTRGPRCSVLDTLSRYPAARRWSGSRRSPRTWEPGPSSTGACTACCATTTRFATSAGPSRPARPPAASTVHQQRAGRPPHRSLRRPLASEGRTFAAARNA